MEDIVPEETLKPGFAVSRALRAAHGALTEDGAAASRGIVLLRSRHP
jgi:hypothetical protein